MKIQTYISASATVREREGEGRKTPSPYGRRQGSSTIAVICEILHGDNDIGPIRDTNGAETLRGRGGKEWLQSDGGAILLKQAA